MTITLVNQQPMEALDVKEGYSIFSTGAWFLLRFTSRENSSRVFEKVCRTEEECPLGYEYEFVAWSRTVTTEPYSPTRKYVDAFARAMESKLAQNRYKGDRSGWLSSTRESLVTRLEQELSEWLESPTLDEAADIANFLMFIADKDGLLIQDVITKETKS